MDNCPRTQEFQWGTKHDGNDGFGDMSKIPTEKGGQDFSEYLFNDPDREWLKRKYECGEKVG